MLQSQGIAIIGTGLLGGSLGLGLRAAGFDGRIIGLGRNIATVQRAMSRGCVETAMSLDDLPRAAAICDMVVMATPLGAFGGILTKLAGCWREGMTITDVGSTKQQVCGQARASLPQPGWFVGSHPMAGSEKHGHEAAVADLFRGKPCVLTPEPDTQAAAVERVEELWTMLGMKLIRLTPAEHDARAARVSHLPHALAAALIQLASRDNALRMASTGFRDTTRVASGDPLVWLDIFTTNRQAVLEAMDEFRHDLTRLRNLLANDDGRKLEKYLARSKKYRDQWLADGGIRGDEL